jgi:hypothetical protein
MEIYKIVPRSLPTSQPIYRDDTGHIKAVKLKLLANKRLPKHQQQGFLMFIIPLAGQLQAIVDDTNVIDIPPCALLAVDGEHWLSLLGQAEENPFLYFIIRKNNNDMDLFMRDDIGLYYYNDFIKFEKCHLSADDKHIISGEDHNQTLIIGGSGELSVQLVGEEKERFAKLMHGDILQYNSEQTAQVIAKSDATFMVVSLRIDAINKP